MCWCLCCHLHVFVYGSHLLPLHCWLQTCKLRKCFCVLVCLCVYVHACACLCLHCWPLLLLLGRKATSVWISCPPLRPQAAHKSQKSRRPQKDLTWTPPQGAKFLPKSTQEDPKLNNNNQKWPNNEKKSLHSTQTSTRRTKHDPTITRIDWPLTKTQSSIATQRPSNDRTSANNDKFAAVSCHPWPSVSAKNPKRYESDQKRIWISIYCSISCFLFEIIVILSLDLNLLPGRHLLASRKDALTLYQNLNLNLNLHLVLNPKSTAKLIQTNLNLHKSNINLHLTATSEKP